MDIETWRQAVAADFGTLSRTPQDRLTWVTVIIDARVVRLTEDIEQMTLAQIEQFRDDPLMRQDEFRLLEAPADTDVTSRYALG